MYSIFNYSKSHSGHSIHISDEPVISYEKNVREKYVSNMLRIEFIDHLLNVVLTNHLVLISMYTTEICWRWHSQMFSKDDKSDRDSRKREGSLLQLKCGTAHTYQFNIYLAVYNINVFEKECVLFSVVISFQNLTLPT